jgi:hypothetical protein
MFVVEVRDEFLLEVNVMWAYDAYVDLGRQLL